MNAASTIRPQFNPLRTSRNCWAWYNAKRGVTTSGSTITAVSDLSPNGYNLSVGGSPTLNATGINGAYPCMTFSGTTQNLYRSGIGGSNRTTFSFWAIIKRGASTNFHAMWYAPSSANWAGATNDTYIQDAAAANSISYWVSGVGERAAAPAQTFPLNEVIEICGTYDGTTLKLYKNNVEVGTATISNCKIGNKLMLAGLGQGQSGGYSGYDWNGSIAEIAFFDNALTATDRANLHRYGQYNWFNIWQSNQNSFNFNSGSYLTAGTGVMNYEYTQPISFSVWLKPDSGWTDKGSICGRESAASTHEGFDYLRELNGKLSFFMGNDATHYIYAYSSGSVLANGTRWTHCVCTYSGSGTAAGVKFYIDGVLQSTTNTSDNLSGSILNGSVPFYIAEAWGTTPYYGNMNQLSIWTKVLSQAEVTQIYNLGIPCDLNSLGISDLLHWWYLSGSTDTVTDTYDQAGSADCTTVGTGLLQPLVPLPFK